MPCQVTQVNGQNTINSNINTSLFPFTYSSDGFRALGYRWQSDIDYASNQQINFWRAQLAFRGFSPRGTNAEALKERLRKTEMREMDSKVAADKVNMKDAWKLLEAPIPQVDNSGLREESPKAEEEVDEEDMDDGEENEEDEEEQEEDKEEKDHGPGPWNITGNWKIECRDLLYWSDSPLTIEIETHEQRLGHQTYGRFDFRSWNSVFQFTTEEEGQSYGRYEPEDFILGDSNLPSEENPTCYYRWRGIEVGEDVIQLGEDNHLYSMTFSENGMHMKGTWGCQNGEPGTISFTGVKAGYGGYGGMDIQREWNARNEAAYDGANRNRWKRY